MNSKRVTGIVSLHPKGFGFLNYEVEGQDEAGSAFIAPPDLNPFMEGDQIAAEIREAKDGRFSAHNLSLEKRTRAELFGQVTQHKDRLFLKTDREICNTDWPIEGEAKAGDYVIGRVEGRRVKVSRILGPDADIPLERLIHRFELRSSFDESTREQIQEILKTPHQLGSRKDLRDIPTVTIDSASTKDIDDAVSVLPADSDGALRLLVSIADPAAFIEEDSPLDRETQTRGTSTYLVDRVLPMLPDELSSGHLSLHPGVDRCCLTAELRIDHEGEILSTDVYESLINSRTRITYDELAGWLDYGDMTAPLELIEFTLPWLRTASARLSVARKRRGGVNMSGSKMAEVKLDETGRVCGTSPSGTTSAHMLIERFMVAANEAVAKWLVDRGLPGTFRVHPEPDEEEVGILADSCREFGYEPGFGRRLTPGSLAAFDNQIVGDVAEPAIRSVLRGVLKRAHYTVHPNLHLGLGAPLYLHFTSPLRRYADFAVHRLIKSYLAGRRTFDVDDSEVEKVAQHLNERAAQAAKAESLRRRMLMAEYMTNHIGEEFKAYITRILPFGMVAQLSGSLVEGLVPTESLSGGPWTSTNISLQSPEQSFTLGHRVKVKVISTDPELGQIEYALLAE